MRSQCKYYENSSGNCENEDITLNQEPIECFYPSCDAFKDINDC